MFNVINELVTKLSKDPFDPKLCFSIATEYELVGQTAAAISFYLRAAEYGYYSHPEYVYASLLKSANCFENQKNRQATVENLFLKAVAYQPGRPEAWFLLSRYSERNKNWQQAYTYAETGLYKLSGNHAPLPIGVDYPGDFCLTFQKAVAAWWVGRQDESQQLFTKLSKMALPTTYSSSVKSNLDFMGIGEDIIESDYDKYLNDGFTKVGGWVVRTLPEFMKVLNVDWNKEGGVAEIGVYMGRFFLLLRNMIDTEENSYAIDIFEDQHLNSDSNGGQGSTDIFKENLKNYDNFKGKKVNIIKGDSTSGKTQSEISSQIKPGSIRYFSIDGGHTKTHTLNDLKLAEKYVSDTGIVILDDITHPHWLGVMDGLVEYLRTFPTLIPFAIGHNKLFLCKYPYHEKYLKLVEESEFGIERITFMGYQLWVSEKVYIQ